MKKYVPKNLRALIKIICLVLLCLLLILPLPYRIEIPGEAKPLNESIVVSGHGAPVRSGGGFYLPTVKTAPVNISLLIYNLFDRYSEIHPLTSEAQAMSKKQQEETISQLQMRVSENIAVWEAFRLAKKPIDFEYGGAYVTEVARYSSFHNKLRPLDLITHLDGQRFESNEEMLDYIKKQKVGDQVTLKFQREMDGEKKEQEVEGNYIQLDNGKTGIGMSLMENTSLISNPEVKIKVGDISGPSGGLLFTLDIYSKLTGKDITKGRKVAGSASITVGGAVWPVGGIRQKVVAAERQDIDVFFVYSNGRAVGDYNYLEAKETVKWLRSDMSIIPIDNVNDAIEYLEGRNTTWIQGSDAKDV